MCLSVANRSSELIEFAQIIRVQITLLAFVTVIDIALVARYLVTVPRTFYVLPWPLRVAPPPHVAPPMAPPLPVATPPTVAPSCASSPSR